MVWIAGAPYKEESKKIVWEVAPYLRGRGVDLGAGSFKVLPHVISVDNEIDNALFGFRSKADVKVRTAEELDIFAARSMDFVYSSHLLEHFEDPEKVLKEWWRILKIKGYLILYLPHEDHYPKMGSKDANPDHKHDLNPEKIINWMLKVGFWDLEECQVRSEDDEYSFLMVFKKLDHQVNLYSYKYPKPEKTALVVRYGAFGDMIMASPIFKSLKDKGYHVTLHAAAPGVDVVAHDPNVDKIIIFDKDQVPNGDLGSFWVWQKKKYTKFINLSESVEATFLAMPGRTEYTWSPAVRHYRTNFNYVEFAHRLAGLEFDPKNVPVKFFATDKEKAWAKSQRAKFGGDLMIMWSLSGSAVHKTWAGMDHIIGSILVHYPESRIVLVGGPDGVILEAGWEKEKRVICTSGKWTIRESMAFLSECDVIIGPETGMLNAACDMDVSKIIFLSHSTHENLCRDWKNVISIQAQNTTCPGRGENEAPACHEMHYGWDHCKKHEESGTAQCMADISVEEVWTEVDWVLSALVARKVA